MGFSRLALHRSSSLLHCSPLTSAYSTVRYSLLRYDEPYVHASISSSRLASACGSFIVACACRFERKEVSRAIAVGFPLILSAQQLQDRETESISHGCPRTEMGAIVSCCGLRELLLSR